MIAGFPAGPWGTNCFVAATGPGTECVVIDPGKDAAQVKKRAAKVQTKALEKLLRGRDDD